jgi:ethanolamine utilization protein EutP (predicted NTPase)
LRARVAAELGPLPFTLLVNKADLAEAWAVSDGELDALRAGGWSVLRTSAKTGESVEDAFRELAVRVTR